MKEEYEPGVYTPEDLRKEQIFNSKKLLDSAFLKSALGILVKYAAILEDEKKKYNICG